MKAGRHRTFDKDIALEQAMEVFWANGYAGTSLADLTTAMGINKPSLYAAFGNKEQLYQSALVKYLEKHGMKHVQHLMSADTCLSDRIKNYLMSLAEMVTDSKLPGGCFICLSTCEIGCAGIPSDAIQAIANINTQTKASLTAFFENEIVVGNLTNERSAAVMANYLISQICGLAVMAKSGAKFTELQQVVELSIQQF